VGNVLIAAGRVVRAGGIAWRSGVREYERVRQDAGPRAAGTECLALPAAGKRGRHAVPPPDLGPPPPRGRGHALRRRGAALAASLTAWLARRRVWPRAPLDNSPGSG